MGVHTGMHIHAHIQSIGHVTLTLHPDAAPGGLFATWSCIRSYPLQNPTSNMKCKQMKTFGTSNLSSFKFFLSNSYNSFFLGSLLLSSSWNYLWTDLVVETPLMGLLGALRLWGWGGMVGVGVASSKSFTHKNKDWWADFITRKESISHRPVPKRQLENKKERKKLSQSML